MDDVSGMLGDLGRELRAMRLKPAANVEDWLLPPPNVTNSAEPAANGSYLLKTPLRIAHHFDVAPACLIRDSLLGTLGIVELVLPAEKTSAEKDAEFIHKQVRKHIDTATYARHLLLRDPRRRTKAPYTVELVLLTSSADDTADAIGWALRELLRTTDSLFHVGVGLLVHHGGADPFRGGLHRALPWLLTATRAWLDSGGSKPAGAQSAGNASRGRLERVTLSNYRLSGKREFRLSNTRLHLIHGPNGSGKSSLVEALELVTVGKVERLERAAVKDYTQVINNRAANMPASIDLQWARGLDEPRPVLATGLADPLDCQVHASSFRLDQPLMEKLIGQVPHERANIFLEAFFPEARQSLASYSVAAKELERALEQVKASVEDVVDEAQKVLKEIANWRGFRTSETSDELSSLLNRWLERTVLADLAQREHHVRATLQEAREARWTIAREPAIGLLGGADVDLATIGEQARRWAAEVEDLQRKLASLRPSTRSEQVGEGSPIAITPSQVDALNRVSRWLFDGDLLSRQGSLGDKIAKVMSAGDSPTYGSLEIGSEGWTSELVRGLNAITLACQHLKTEQAPDGWPGKDVCADYEAAAKHRKESSDAGAELSASFLKRLTEGAGTKGEFDGSLIAALNEVMALFTPARWAYDDIRLPSTFSDGGVGVNIELGEGERRVRAELHLNTAQLNLFTVALFLLCAGRVRKPLGLLVFDDPLQNMDELTATALSRGLAKLVRLWPEVNRHEELLLLFHGYDDLERFRGELAAAVYRLPWLSPGLDAAKLEIEGEQTGGIEIALQSLDGLFERREPDTGS